jgi:hypothetical protein
MRCQATGREQERATLARRTIRGSQSGGKLCFACARKTCCGESTYRLRCGFALCNSHFLGRSLHLGDCVVSVQHSAFSNQQPARTDLQRQLDSPVRQWRGVGREIEASGNDWRIYSLCAAHQEPRSRRTTRLTINSLAGHFDAPISSSEYRLDLAQLVGVSRDEDCGRCQRCERDGVRCVRPYRTRSC